jgi:monoamine oxidase
MYGESVMEHNESILIIGAGAAGLAAATKLGEVGLPVVVVEARNRIGGRILTQRDPSCEASIELGAEFIHGLPPEIWDLLDKTKIEEVEGDGWCASDGQLRPCEIFSQVDSILVAMDDSEPDESFLAFLERKFPNPAQDARLAEAKRRAIGYVSGFNAADPDLVSVHWLVAGMRAEEKLQGHRAFRSRNGYADLIDVFRRKIAHSNVRIQTGTIVQRIVWSSRSAQLDCRTDQGPLSFRASQVLVTLPLSLLKSSQVPGAVEFAPSLPREKIAALDSLEMGTVIRIILRFRDRFWSKIPSGDGGRKTLSDMGFLFSEDESFPTWWTAMPRKEPLITGWAPFRSGERLSGRDESDVVGQAVETLSRLLGVRDLVNQLEAAYLHDWQSDPFSRGAYSYAKVGADGAQAALTAPVENTLFFAGEACDTSGNNGTVHAAIASGYRAAQEIIDDRQLRRTSF